jgi:hypothetical protein
MKKLYKVTLTPDERQSLTELVSTGKSNAKKIKHANVRLVTECGYTVAQVAEQPGCSQVSIQRWKEAANRKLGYDLARIENGTDRDTFMPAALME